MLVLIFLTLLASSVMADSDSTWIVRNYNLSEHSSHYDVNDHGFYNQLNFTNHCGQSVTVSLNMSNYFRGDYLVVADLSFVVDDPYCNNYTGFEVKTINLPASCYMEMIYIYGTCKVSVVLLTIMYYLLGFVILGTVILVGFIVHYLGRKIRKMVHRCYKRLRKKERQSLLS